MKAKEQKGMLAFIIILLCIFIPLTAFASYALISGLDTESKMKHVNTKHEFKFEGKLYFYKDDKEIGTYTCKSIDNYCDYAISTIDDEKYNIRYHKVESNQKISLIENRYAFIMDAKNILEAKVILYDVVENKILATFNAVKNYSLGLESGNIIASDETGKWGVISLKNGYEVKVPFQYDFIGLQDEVMKNTNKIVDDYYIANINNFWYLIDENEAKMTKGYQNTIVKYNNNSLLLQGDIGMQLLDYNGNAILDGYFESLDFLNRYILVVTKSKAFYIYDPVTENRISNNYTYSNTLEAFINDTGNIEVRIDGALQETISIS